jgi:selenium metabolism protein YedF
MTDPIDVRALPCPGPVIELRKRLDRGLRQVDLLVADALARSNVTRFALSRGAEVHTEPVEGGFLLHIRAQGGAGETEPEAEEPPRCDRGERPPRVVQLCADTMGGGDPELGALLLRGFLATLAKAEPGPDVVVCYNSAVRLCCEDAPTLASLRAFAEGGAEIVACGTCLNFYGLSERLAVGRVTDMLEIVTLLSHATQVIRP